MNKCIKFFQVPFYIISPVTCYDIDHVEREDFGSFTVRILHGKPLTRKRSFHVKIGIVQRSPCLKHIALYSLKKNTLNNGRKQAFQTAR